MDVINSFMTGAVIIKKPVHWTGFYMIAISVMKELTFIQQLLSIEKKFY